METKKEIRKRIRQRRKETEETVWRRYSDQIASAVITHPWFLSAVDLYTYVDYNREAGTRRIIDTAFEKGKSVWVPKVAGEIMHFYRIESREDLEPGAYGILEPAFGPADRPEIDSVGRTDEEGANGRLMIMPGVAFDEMCHRVGYGGGYYDRYLAEHPMIHTMALAFEFQIFPEVPHGEYDICPKILITEEREISSETDVL